MRLVYMRPTLLALTLVGCAVVAPAATSQPAAKAGAETGPPAAVLDRLHGNPGETMEYVITLRGMTVGRVQTAIGQPGWIEGRPAVIVTSRATAEGLVAMATEYRGELTTTLDLERGYPIAMRKEEWMVIAGKPDHTKYERSWHDADTHEVHSAAGVLRGWRSRPGDRGSVQLWFGGGTEVLVTDAGRELIGDGNRPAVRYDGRTDENAFQVWISDDVARVPLRMRATTKLGVIEADLVHYEAPPE